MPRFDKIAFVASETKEAEEALVKLTERYGNTAFAEADAIVALGGDGLMLPDHAPAISTAAYRSTA